MYKYSCPRVLQVDSYVQVSLAAFGLVDLSNIGKSMLRLLLPSSLRSARPPAPAGLRLALLPRW